MTWSSWYWFKKLFILKKINVDMFPFLHLSKLEYLQFSKEKCLINIYAFYCNDFSKDQYFLLGSVVWFFGKSLKVKDTLPIS